MNWEVDTYSLLLALFLVGWIVGSDVGVGVVEAVGDAVAGVDIAGEISCVGVVTCGLDWWVAVVAGMVVVIAVGWGKCVTRATAVGELLVPVLVCAA